MTHFVLTPDRRERELDVVGTKVTILASNAATRSYGITFQRGGEGMGPPPHSHDWDESFYVLAGEVEFVCGAEATPCGAGTLVHVPRGTVHAFRYGQGGGEMLEITSPDSRAAEMFTAIDRDVPPGPLDVPKVLEVLGRSGVSVAV